VRARLLGAIGEVDAAAWNALDRGGSPFLSHEFLAAAELSGSAVPETGWTPAHVLVETPRDGVVGALPLYLKTHSFGEFVFDFAWARAYERHGLPYYPKLVSGPPFTPATGRRFLVRPGCDRERVCTALLAAARELLRESGASSLHALFVDEADQRWLSDRGLLARKDCQFHWHNRSYATFDDFLGTFTAEKRKKARRERRRVAESGISFEWLAGAELNAPLLRTVFGFYADTFVRHGHAPYLNLEFFQRIARSLPTALEVALARRHGTPVACAICFRGTDTLYGRYWGADGAYHSLHFETCYYQGIERCIQEGLARFEPGTQGEHKLARGFTPVPTWSMHEIADPAFGRAIAAFLDREALAVDAYMRDAAGHVPYRRDVASLAMDLDGPAHVA
jgi:hypothetical protein